MQVEFDKHNPSANIQILGINEVGRDSNNDGFTNGRDIPWLQDVDMDENNVSDVWYDSWQITYRDVVVLDADNEMIDVFNVTDNNLASEANFQSLKNSFLDGVERQAESAWQNPLEPLNVNDDEFISPIDALLVINALSEFPDGMLPVGGPDANDPKYLDCSGTPEGNVSIVSPVDALLVINQLTFIANYDDPQALTASRSASPTQVIPAIETAEAVLVEAHVDETMAQLGSVAATTVSDGNPELRVHQPASLIDPFQARGDRVVDAEDGAGTKSIELL